MKIFLKLLIALLIPDIVSAQNTFPIKEHYDKLYSSVYAPANFDYNYCYATGNSLSWTLSGLLRMYETTGDKAYLVKFINHCIQLQKIRKDESGTEAVAAWVGKNDNSCYENNENGSTEPAYFNSLLIYPMAEFVNMVINEPGHTLYNSNLPIQPNTTQNIVDISTLNSMNPGFQVLGYGDFANWLGKRVEETMMYMNNSYWNNSFGIKGHFSDGSAIHGTAMNMNSPYGCALLYMGLANTNFGFGNNRANYLYKAQFIASYYKGNMDIEDHCSGLPCNSLSYSFPVLRTMANNSFFWYHAGWSFSTRNCSGSCFPYTDQPDYNNYVNNIEDLSHGAMDLWFAKACYEAQLAPDNLSPPYFDEIDMERFRNTFTKNVYFTNGTGTHFHNCVNGSDNQFTGNSCSPSCPSDLFYGEALAWMPMYNYDGNSLPNVYDILMQHTTGLISPTSPPSVQNLTGAQSFQGLSEVVKAQWDKECINLTLYNRDVVYNQDFIVKNKLMIAPEQVDDFHQLNGNSFADPITTNNTFLVESGKTVNMVAGESIQFLSGFVATTGSNFRASINPSACTNGRMYTAIQNNDKGNLSSSLPMDVSTKIIGQQAKIKNEATSATLTNNISIFPNPNNGTFKITVMGKNKSIVVTELKVYDMMGKIIWQTGASGNNVFEVDITGYSKGIYYVRTVNDAGEIEVQKLIKQ